MEGYANPYTVAAQSENVRTAFIKKTYLHVAGAIAAFTLLEIIFFQIPAMMSLAETMATSGMGWLLVLAAFMVVSFIADKWARSSTSQGMQYAGLGLYVVAEAIIFLPLLYIANMYATMVPGCEGIITEAAVLTLLMVAGLTVIVFTTKKDFSFMGGFLKIAFFVALGIIVASFVAGFQLGWIFSAAMILLASGSILYTTSNILHHYRTDQYVAASLSLFAGVALLFWYVLQLLMQLANND